MRENAFCMVFHVRWISHHLSLNPTLVAPRLGRDSETRGEKNPSHMENHTKSISSFCRKNSPSHNITTFIHDFISNTTNMAVGDHGRRVTLSWMVTVTLHAKINVTEQYNMWLIFKCFAITVNTVRYKNNRPPLSSPMLTHSSVE